MVPPPLLELTVTVGADAALIIIVIGFEVAVVGLAQAELDVSSQVITSPLASVVEVKVALLVPTLVVPFFFQA
jgi:hypothetical protein